MFEKIILDDIQFFFRCYLFVGFKFECEIGNDLLQVENVSVMIDGKKILDDIFFNLSKEDKVVFVVENDIIIIMLFKVIMGEIILDIGIVCWGVIISYFYLLKDIMKEFDMDLMILDWLC